MLFLLFSCIHSLPQGPCRMHSVSDGHLGECEIDLIKCSTLPLRLWDHPLRPNMSQPTCLNFPSASQTKEILEIASKIKITCAFFRISPQYVASSSNWKKLYCTGIKNALSKTNKIRAFCAIFSWNYTTIKRISKISRPGEKLTFFYQLLNFNQQFHMVAQ